MPFESLLQAQSLAIAPVIGHLGESIFQQLFEHSLDATLVWQSVGALENRLVACNQAAIQLFGYTEQDLLQFSHQHLSHSRQPHGTDAANHPMRGSGTPQWGCHRFEWCYQTAGDRPFLAEVTLWAIALSDTQTLFYEVCRPIRTCPNASSFDDSSLQLLQTVLDTLPLAIFWKDRQSVYLGCNQIFAEAAGLAYPHQIIGLTDYDLPWTTEEADTYRHNDQQVMTSQTAQYHLMEPQQQANGQHIWCDTNKIPLYDSTGDVIGILGTFEDVTPRKEYEDALERKAQNLEDFIEDLQQKQTKLIQTEKMSSLGQLVAGVAHEINNPVNFIHGNLSHARSYIQDLLSIIQAYQSQYPNPTTDIQDLIEDVDLDYVIDDLPRGLDSMQVGTHRIRAIIASLRTFSRLDEAEVKAVDIHAGLDSTTMILRGRLKAKAERPEIQLHKDYGTLPKVKCYAGQLNQVFMNILSNAIDALDERDNQRTPEANKADPSQIWISTRVVGDRPNVQISIRDNGPGIPEHVQQRIFDPFFTTKPVGKGTGLGMSISHQIIVERHEGQLTYHSTPDTGTEFIIEIPIQSASQIDD
ncbi:MAG: ATP-binding protein [Leptolyngbyaceae bacterium]|nr:ATP-binding protein [Leptolyngbyaceae bacterium]